MLNNVYVEDSILNTVKHQLGITDEYTYFDDQLIIFINATFTTLYQLGVGDNEEFSITGPDEKWSDYLTDISKFKWVQPYVYLKVKLMFDPPTSSFLIEAINKQCEEFEWRMCAYKDNERNKDAYETRQALKGLSSEMLGNEGI